MTKRKRARTGGKRRAGPSAKTIRVGSARTRRSLVVGLMISVAVVVAGIVVGTGVWSPKRVSHTGTESPRPSSAIAEPATAASRQQALREPSAGESSAPPGEPEQAEPAPADIRVLEEETLDAIGQLVKTLPGEVDPLKEMGKLYADLGQWDEAMRWWRRCLEIDPKRPDVHDLMAQAAVYAEEYGKAAEFWRKVIAVAPRLPGIRNKLAKVLIDLNETDEAIAVLEEELDVSPGERTPRERTLSYFLLGKAYLQLREYEKARESYEAAVEIDPKHGRAWYGLATAYVRLGRSEEAQKCMEKFETVKAAKTSRPGFRSEDLLFERFIQARMRVAATYHANGYLPLAEQQWRSVAELAPKNVASRDKLCKLYLASGEYDKVLPIRERMVKIEPNNPVIRANLGAIYARMNRIDAALTEIQRAIDIDPGCEQYRQLYRTLQEKKQRDRQK